MSRETAKSTEAERFVGLVGPNAFASSVADMFLGYVDNVLRGLTVLLRDTRVGGPPSFFFFWGVVVDSSPSMPRSPAFARKPVSSPALASTSSARTRMSHLLHQWGTSSALRSKACVRPALPPIAPGLRPLAWPSPWAAVAAVAAKAYLRSSLAPYSSLRTSLAPALCGCRPRTTKSAR